MTETGLTLTFDGVNFGAVDPLTNTDPPASTQLDSDNWAVDLDNDNVFDGNGGTAGFGGNYIEGYNYTATVDTWDDFDERDGIFSFNYNLDGATTTAPSISFAVSPQSPNDTDALITKIQNTSTLEYTDLELTLDAFYYYDWESWAGPAEGTIGIFYFVSSTNITTDISSATWTEITTLTNNAETTDGWKQFTTGTYGINGVSLDVNEYLYLKFVFSAQDPEYVHKQALAMDNIAITPVGFGGTDATTTLSINETGSSTTLDPTSSSSEIFRFSVVDDGASDGYATTFSELVVSTGTDNDISDWTTLFETVTLTDITGGGSTTATIGSNTLTFSSLAFASATDIGYVTDATSKEYSLTIDFVDTYSGSQNVNNEVLQFLVQSSDIEIEGVSSTFQTANSVQTTSTNNVMSVTADQLELQDEPSVVGTGNTSDVYFGFTVRAVDAAGHLDTDISSALMITELTETLSSGGVLSFSSGTASSNFTAGEYDYTDLFFNTSGSYTISIGSSGYADESFSITAATSWRSANDGDWGNSTGDVWEYFVDGVGWTSAAANEHPNATSASVGPIYINNTVAIETTTYNSDQLFIESGGTLDINNAFTINDDGTPSIRDLTIRDGGVLDVEADVTISSGATFLVEGGSSIAGGGIITSGSDDYILDFGASTSGYWETYSILRYTADATIALTGNTTLFPNASSTQYPLFEVDAIRFKALSNGGFTLTINGIMYYTDPDRLEMTTNDYIVRDGFISAPGSDLRHDNVTSMTGDTLFFSGNIYSQGAEFDLDITSSAPSVIQLIGDVESTGNDKINFDVQSGGTLILDDYDSDFGDWTFQDGSTIKVSNASGFGADQFAGADNLTINTGTIFHFNGTAAAQNTGFGTLDGGTTSVSDIIIDNTSTSGTVSLDSDITLTGSITFENGIFQTQATTPGVLTVSSSTTFSGYSASSHIQGPVSFAAFASSKFIPIGADNGGTDYYRPVIVDPVSSTTVITEYTRSDPNTDISNTFDTDGTDNPEALTTSGYFTITFGATGTADIALYFDNTDDAIAGSTDLIIAKYDNSASEWVGYESSAFGADYLLATVTIDDVADVYFTVASTTTSLLPVELINFGATKEGQQVVLDWSTASELNNDRFEVEQSRNGWDFGKIGEVDGSGTTSKLQTYSFIHSKPSLGTNYYRLKQVDFDGAYEYSTTIRTTMDDIEGTLQLLQNPIEERTVRFTYEVSDNPQITVTDIAGKVYQNVNVQRNAGIYELDISSFPQGTYLLFVGDQVVRFIAE